MNQTLSSREHVVSCLLRIRAAVGWGPNADEWLATLGVFVPSLQRCNALDVREACERWAEDKPRWPSLAALLDEVTAARHRREPKRLASVPVEPVGRRKPTIRDPVAMRRLIEDMRRHPAKYVAPKALIAIGEDMLERAGVEQLEPA